MHFTSTRNVRDEYQPYCACGWRILPCVSRGAAQQWCMAHMRYSRHAALTPYTYDELMTAK